jgi:hypothetical protein
MIEMPNLDPADQNILPELDLTLKPSIGET